MTEPSHPERSTTRHAATWKLAGLISAVVAISLAHYLTPPAWVHAHVVYQRLYYLPILLAAAAFGLRGGLGVALVTAVLYLPHIFMDWGHEPLYRSAQLAEIVLFLVFGTLAGVLIDRVRHERERHRRTADELRQAYAELQATHERLRLLDRVSALGALSAGLAHEIRTPLGSIAGAVEILEGAVPEGDRRREFVDILKKEIDRLQTLVTRHLDLVRTTPPERGPCDVNALVDSVLTLAGRQAERQGIRIDVRPAEGLPTAQVDAQQIRQAVLNLVINAIQAMPGGGDLVVTTARRKDRACIVVEDSGPGLDETTRSRVFEPFFTTKQGGTGLGLSIAFRIADLHGGDLRAEDRAGGGARFVLEIPVSEATASAGRGVA